MRNILLPTFGTALAVCLTLPLGLAPVAAFAQPAPGSVQQAEVDPPGRVARLDYFEGGVSQLPAGAQDWSPASVNYPLGAGDRIATDAGARAELHLGSTALRLAPQTQMDITTLDDENAYVTLNQGSAVLRVRTLFPGQHLEVNTANLAFSITQPGEYRVDVEAGTGITRVTVPSGGGVVYGETGQTLLLRAPQQIRFSGRNLAQASAQNAAPRDGFDQWAASRDRLEDQSVSAQYVSREVVGYQQLDNYGEWGNAPGVGPVWYPRAVATGWAPYRYGHWRDVAPWGWTWVDDAPWGFAPFHYGRWTQVGPRWAWVPGPIQQRPVYAPALVAFVGGNSGGVNWSLSVGGGQPGVAWFPLAPGEAYRPAYRASPRYVTRINQTIVVNNNVNNGYRFQRPDFVTAQRADAFARGRPTREDFHRVAQDDLSRARVVDRPDVQPNRVQPDRREPPRADNRGPERGFDRTPDRDGRNDRPGFNNNIGAMPNGGLGNPPNPLNPEAAQRDQLRRLQAEDQRQRSFNSMEERQRAQAQQDAQRRGLAEQQQRQLQQGGQFPNANDEAIRRGNEQERARQQQERFQRDQRSQNEQRQQQEAQRQAQQQQQQVQRVQAEQRAQQEQQRSQQESAARQAQEQQRAQQQAQQQAARAQQQQQQQQGVRSEQRSQAEQRAQQQRPDRSFGSDESRRPGRVDRPERPERQPPPTPG